MSNDNFNRDRLISGDRNYTSSGRDAVNNATQKYTPTN